MEDQTNEPVAPVEPEIEEEEVEELEPQANETPDWEARAKRLEEKAITQRERTRALKAEVEKLRKATAPVHTEAPKTGELDETQLDYLDLKGISETDDLDVIQSIIKKTGMTVRQALKDDYVIKKLEANKAGREVKEATPSSTRRTGNSQTNDLATALAKYEQTGKFPDDFTMKSAVINAIVEKENTNKPAWH